MEEAKAAMEKAKQKMIESGVDPFTIEPTEDRPATESGIIGASGHDNLAVQVSDETFHFTPLFS